MKRNDSKAWRLPGPGIARHVAALTGELRGGWRSLTPTQFWWTLCLGLVGGLFFLISQSMHKMLRWVLHTASPGNTLLESAIALGMTIVVAFLLLLAVNVAANGDREQPRAWLRYVIATLVAVGASTALVHLLSPYAPIGGLVGWYRVESQAAIDWFVFLNWTLFGGLAIFVYVRLRRVRRSEAAFERAELERAAVGRQVLMSQLAAMQAQVEPTFLFNTLSQIEALYDRDAAGANQILDNLITYLRAALPQMRDDRSTLARESQLADTYLRIVQARMGSRLEFAFHIPEELGAIPFPPMLLLPLIDNAVRHGLEPLPLGGRVDVRAASNAGRLRLTVADSGLGDATNVLEGHGLTNLRRRLNGLYGELASLSLSSTHQHGVTAAVEVPAYEHTSDHR